MADQIGNLIDEKELTPIYVKGNTTSTSSNFFIDSNPKAEGFLIGIGSEGSGNSFVNKISINTIEGYELKEGTFYFGQITIHVRQYNQEYKAAPIIIENNTNKNLKLYFQFTSPLYIFGYSSNSYYGLNNLSFVKEINANTVSSREFLGTSSYSSSGDYFGLTFSDCKVTITFI